MEQSWVTKASQAAHLRLARLPRLETWPRLGLADGFFAVRVLPLTCRVPEMWSWACSLRWGGDLLSLCVLRAMLHSVLSVFFALTHSHTLSPASLGTPSDLDLCPKAA